MAPQPASRVNKVLLKTPMTRPSATLCHLQRPLGHAAPTEASAQAPNALNARHHVVLALDPAPTIAFSVPLALTCSTAIASKRTVMVSAKEPTGCSRTITRTNATPVVPSARHARFPTSVLPLRPISCNAPGACLVLSSPKESALRAVLPERLCRLKII